MNLDEFIQQASQMISSKKFEMKIVDTGIIDPGTGKVRFELTFWNKNKELKAGFTREALPAVILQIVMLWGNFYATIAQAEPQETEPKIVHLN